MPKSKNYEQWLKDNYPRTCEVCGHICNSPAAYSYHKRKHEPIPAGQVCDFGCGEQAQYRGTGGKYSCTKISHNCPEYLRNHSERITKQWAGNTERRKQATSILKEFANTPEAKARAKATLEEKYGSFTPEQMKDFRHYARRIRARAQRWAKDNGYELGQQTFHVDHKLSVWDAWQAGLSEDVVNHPANLRVIPAKENISKGRNSILTVEELLEAIK